MRRLTTRTVTGKAGAIGHLNLSTSLNSRLLAGTHFCGMASDQNANHFHSWLERRKRNLESHTGPSEGRTLLILCHLAQPPHPNRLTTRTRQPLMHRRLEHSEAGGNQPARAESKPAGDADHLYRLAEHYIRQQTEFSLKRAFELLGHAAGQGHIPSKHLLGTLLIGEYVTTPDYDKARKLFEEILEEELYPPTQYDLACLYLYNYEGEVKRKVVPLLQSAAAANFTPAKTLLGDLYRQGELVNKNAARALQLTSEAAAEGDAAALNNMGAFYQHGDGVPIDLTKAREYYEQAAQQNFPPAHYNLALLYDKGLGVKMNTKKAVQGFKEAFRLGFSEAAYRLGVMFAKGTHETPKNVATAFRWFEKAAAMGHLHSIYSVGRMCLLGYALPEKYFKYDQQEEVEVDEEAAKELDYLERNFDKFDEWVAEKERKEKEERKAKKHQKKEEEEEEEEEDKVEKEEEEEEVSESDLGTDLARAARYLQMAATRGHTDAQYSIAVMCIDGRGVEQDYKAAAYWLTQAAAVNEEGAEGEKGLPAAQYELARLYESGKGVEKDEEKAKKLYALAERNGFVIEEKKTGEEYKTLFDMW